MTLSAIILAFVIAFGGLFFMQWKLQQQEEILLSEKKIIKSEVSVNNGDKNSPTKKVLTEKELIEIVQSIENNKNVTPHEPKNSQLSMEQAIEQGKIWIKDFFAEYIGNDVVNLKEIKSISANLCVNNPAGKYKISDILYSYWKITLENSDVKVNMVMNSVTGQIINILICSYKKELEFSSANTESLLDHYIETLQLQSSFQYEKSDGFSYRKITNGELYAVIQKGNIMVESTKNKIHYKSGNSLNLYLSTSFLEKE